MSRKWVSNLFSPVLKPRLYFATSKGNLVTIKSIITKYPRILENEIARGLYLFSETLYDLVKLAIRNNQGEVIEFYLTTYPEVWTYHKKELTDLALLKNQKEAIESLLKSEKSLDKYSRYILSELKLQLSWEMCFSCKGQGYSTHTGSRIPGAWSRCSTCYEIGWDLKDGNHRLPADECGCPVCRGKGWEFFSENETLTWAQCSICNGKNLPDQRKVLLMGKEARGWESLPPYIRKGI